MAFTVETGTASSSSNAYISVAYADTFHADRQHAPWAAFDTAKKEACIIRASEYVDKRFSRRFRGRKIQPRTQAMEFPRVDLYDRNNDLIAASNEIPRRLQQAVAEYALRAGLVGELAPDAIPMVPRQDLTDADYEQDTEFVGGQVRRISSKVDVIEESKTYNTAADLTVASRGKELLSGLVTSGNIPEYPAADLLIEDLLRSGGDRTVRRA